MKTDTRNSAVGCIILAAGQGTRMKSYQTKIRIPFFGKPLIEHMIDHLIQSGIPQPVLVVSPDDYSDLSSLYHQKVILAIQKEPLGTGDAVKAGLGVLPESAEYCLIVCGDTPLLSPSTLPFFISFLPASRLKLQQELLQPKLITPGNMGESFGILRVNFNRLRSTKMPLNNKEKFKK